MKKKPKLTKKKKPLLLKRFVIKKYIMATSAIHALQKERKVRPDDCWVDEEWKKENPNQLVSAIGFRIQDEDDYYEEDDLAKLKSMLPVRRGRPRTRF